MAVALAITAMVAAVVVALQAVRSAGVAAEKQTATLFAVGDCVVIPSSLPDVLRARKATCAADPSYTVGATTDASGTCPNNEFQQFPSQFADPTTARLCLVPNLVADHCYVLDMPVGMVALADCADRARGVVVQVTRRLDMRDHSACPLGRGQYAWPYPSPARTYCTVTLS